jgi:hypothetical protein
MELPCEFSLGTESDLAAQARAVLLALVAGDLAPTQAATVIKALSDVAKIVEVEDLAKRIAALEEQQSKRAIT